MLSYRTFRESVWRAPPPIATTLTFRIWPTRQPPEQLDEVEQETLGATERTGELRGRIELLMDEIEISLGVEPLVIASEDAGESESRSHESRQRRSGVTLWVIPVGLAVVSLLLWITA